MGILEHQAVVAKVLNEFEQKDTGHLLYHNLEHTQRVITWASILGLQEGLSHKDLELLQLAAWMHDVGYLFNYHHHEYRGALYAADRMREVGYSSTDIDQVANAILSTRLNQQPTTAMERILNDADFAHFGVAGFHELSLQLRDEIEQNAGSAPDVTTWMEETVALMEAHRFYTTSGNKRLALIKKQNLATLKKQIARKRGNSAKIMI